jgi:glucose/arabinose dehydrogenase
MFQFQYRNLSVLTLILLTLPLQAELVVLTPVADNTLYEDATGVISNGAGSGLYLGKVGTDGDELLRRALIRFDLSEIPANAVINSVMVSVVITQAPKSGAVPDSASLQRVEQAWGEAGSKPLFGAGGQGAPAQVGDATWLHTFYSNLEWNNPGGDFDGLVSATALFGTGNSEQLDFESTTALINDVKRWVTDPSSNYGWILRGDEARSQNARRVASRECPSTPGCLSDPPKLTVDFSVPSIVDNLTLTELTSELSNPVSLSNAGDGSNRLFIVEQHGLIRIYDLQTETLLTEPFLDISEEVFSLADSGGGNEQGLLGLAFHPSYATNGLFYVNYTSSPSLNVWHTVVAEYSVSVDPNIALEAGRIIMEFEQDARNHNGGDLHFGKDGYLYISSGDGGGSNDQYGNAQNTGNLKGGILRIDVDGSVEPNAELCGIVSEYAIPSGNAFPGNNDGCDEILHYGLRNPWRFSFDAVSGGMTIADVGQNAWEEINFLSAGTVTQNFGWPCREGAHEFNPDAECSPPLTDPVLEYPHQQGNCSVTGGYVYRGGQLPLVGSYLYGDWCTHRIWVAVPTQEGWQTTEWEAAAGILSSVSSFGQDENCEIYVADREGKAVYRIGDAERLFSDGYEKRLCRP